MTTPRGSARQTYAVPEEMPAHPHTTLHPFHCGEVLLLSFNSFPQSPRTPPLPQLCRKARKPRRWWANNDHHTLSTRSTTYLSHQQARLC
jgi:hypothetical protein